MTQICQAAFPAAALPAAAVGGGRRGCRRGAERRLRFLRPESLGTGKPGNDSLSPPLATITSAVTGAASIRELPASVGSTVGEASPSLISEGEGRAPHPPAGVPPPPPASRLL